MKISAAESIVMEALWRRAPQDAEEVVAETAKANEWSEATVKTLLNRLFKKGAIVAERDGRKFRYSPALKREIYVREESRSLLKRLFGGDISAFVSNFSQTERLSEEDIAELKRVISEIENDR